MFKTLPVLAVLLVGQFAYATDGLQSGLYRVSRTGHNSDKIWVEKSREVQGPGQGTRFFLIESAGKATERLSQCQGPFEGFRAGVWVYQCWDQWDQTRTFILTL